MIIVTRWHVVKSVGTNVSSVWFVSSVGFVISVGFDCSLVL